MVISQRTLKVKSSLQQEVVADQLRKQRIKAEFSQDELAKLAGIDRKTIQLRKQRIKAEFSQDELAKLAGIDRKTINRIENGHFSPTLDTITRLCVVLKITPGNLLGSGRSTRK